MPHGMPLVAPLLVTAQLVFHWVTHACEGREQGCRQLWLRERPLTVPFNGVAL